MRVERSILAIAVIAVAIAVAGMYYAVSMTTGTGSPQDTATTVAAPGVEEACTLPPIPGFSVEERTRIVAHIVDIGPYTLSVRLDNGSVVEVLIDGKWVIDGENVSSRELASMLSKGETIVVEGYVQQELCPEEGSTRTIIDAVVVEVPGRLYAVKARQ